MARQSSGKIFQLLALFVLCMKSASAHDFWIEPLEFRPKVGSETQVSVRVGQDFKGETIVFLPDLFERYVAVTGKGEKPVAGVPGDETGHFKVDAPGPIVVGYRSVHDRVTFDSVEEFETYLRKEGLDPTDVTRGRSPRTLPIREVYSRAAKSLLYAGPVKDEQADRALGLRLELVAEANPYRLAPGASLPVRLLYQGLPLAGAVLTAFAKEAPLDKVRARTDREGRATLLLARPGVWLVTTIHIMPARPGLEADWESIWASLTFALPAPG